jgi:dihydrofolate reductase
MGKLIVSTAMTVDGVMSVEDWYVSEGGHDQAAREQFDPAGAFVLGRRNFEGLAAYWAPLTGVWADRINPMRKFVASRTLRGPLAWNATLIEGDPAASVAGLKKTLEGDLVTVGCGELTRYLIAKSLVDELRFWIHPAVWGAGERPFWEEERLRLELLGSETFDSGVALMRYRPAAAP